MSALTETEVLRVLQAVERGEITLTPEQEPGRVYAGVVSYAASNGWRLGVFNDANEWDYLAWVEANGERLDFDEIDATMPTLAGYEPPQDTVRRCYRIVPEKRPPKARHTPEDVEAFALVREILRTGRRVPLDAGSAKVLHFALQGAGTDVEISPRTFEVQAGAWKRPVGSLCARRFAPGVVTFLLEQSGVSSVRSPVVVGLPAGSVETTAWSEAWRYDAKLLWIVPGYDLVKLIVRPRAGDASERFVHPVPADGPLALRELPPIAPRYDDLATALACPHCGNTATRYRAVVPGRVYVCTECARSFELHAASEGAAR